MDTKYTLSVPQLTNSQSHICLHEHDLGEISSSIENINKNIEQMIELMRTQSALLVKVDLHEKRLDTIEDKINKIEINTSKFNGNYKWVEKIVLAIISLGLGVLFGNAVNL